MSYCLEIIKILFKITFDKNKITNIQTFERLSVFQLNDPRRLKDEAIRARKCYYNACYYGIK